MTTAHEPYCNAVEEDLRRRWRPSERQIEMAACVVGPDKPVYTCHLLVNKRQSFWTTDVHVCHLDGMFEDRSSTFTYLRAMAEHALTSEDSPYKDNAPITEGYTVHWPGGEWSVFDGPTHTK